VPPRPDRRRRQRSRRVTNPRKLDAPHHPQVYLTARKPRATPLADIANPLAKVAPARRLKRLHGLDPEGPAAAVYATRDEQAVNANAFGCQRGFTARGLHVPAINLGARP